MNIKRGLIVLLGGFIVYFLYWFLQTPVVKQSFDGVECKDQQGKFISMKTLRGKYVLIDVYASWCIDCIRSAPQIKALSDSLLLDGWQVVGVTDDDSTHISKWSQKYQVQFPIWQLQQSYKVLGVTGIPTYFVLDPEGNVLKVINDESLKHEKNLLLFFRKIKNGHE